MLPGQSTAVVPEAVIGRHAALFKSAALKSRYLGMPKAAEL